MELVWPSPSPLVCWVLLNRHRCGANVYTVGDNMEAARLMGINVTRRTGSSLFA